MVNIEYACTRYMHRVYSSITCHVHGYTVYSIPVLQYRYVITCIAIIREYTCTLDSLDPVHCVHVYYTRFVPCVRVFNNCNIAICLAIHVYVHTSIVLKYCYLHGVLQMLLIIHVYIDNKRTYTCIP